LLGLERVGPLVASVACEMPKIQQQWKQQSGNQFALLAPTVLSTPMHAKVYKTVQNNMGALL